MTTTTPRILPVTGDEVLRYLPDVARLRIAVFREFPYLYDGHVDYERQYLETYAGSPGSVVVLALAGDEVVGASTALPMVHEPESISGRFREKGWDITRIFYYGESVLLPEWRRHGLGVAFFVEREAHARRLGGFAHAVFCGVDRPPDHPRRPAGYQPLDAFWRRRGFAPLPGITCTMSWQDLDESTESPKLMRFWGKDLSQPANEPAP